MRDSAQLPTHAHAKRLAAQISLVGGIAIFAAKLGAYLMTSSTAILSDALESTTNIAASALLLLSVALAARPADRSHPYGHGKVELFSAAFEGAMIALAAAFIVLEAGRSLWQGPELSRLDLGLVLVALAGAANGLLGAYVMAAGRRTGSLALVADGRHLLTDALTSAGVVIGLGAVKLTGWVILDPLVALAVAAHLLRTGSALVREAIGGLLDKADGETLERIADALEDARAPSWVDVHSLRTWRSGHVHHVDLHLVVPRFYRADALHELSERLEASVLERSGLVGEVIVHFDPCRPRDCSGCALPDCAMRSNPFRKREVVSVERATRDDEQAENPEKGTFLEN